jgi:hypothetical protein
MTAAETPPTTSRKSEARANDDALLARRAAIARRLVKHGLFDPAEALRSPCGPPTASSRVLAFAADEWVLLHGTLQGYKEGCRCGRCRDAKRHADSGARRAA